MNDFEKYGIDEEEFAAALEESMRLGGATEAEIQAERLAVAVDAAMPAIDPEWVLWRT